MSIEMNIMRKFTDAQLSEKGLSPYMPKHVAIIMDGNGRWAKERGMIRTKGHRAGIERMREIIRHSSDLGIEALSLYAFSTENWKRPKFEVSALSKLFLEYFTKEIDELHANNVKMIALGDTTKFIPEVHAAILRGTERTKNNTGLKLNVALNYGSREEITTAVKSIAKDIEQGKLQSEDISEELISNRLYTASLPDVDLLIRPGGEKRLSNFLLMQCAYAEFVFTDDYWPDFTNEKYEEAIKEFQRRTRRYGGLK